MASDILQVQDFLYKGLLSCELFAAFNVVQERRFLMDSNVEFPAIWQTSRAGRVESGIGLYVEMPKLEVPKPNSLQRNLVVGIVAIEERNTNMTAGVGTLVSAEELAELALDFMFGWVLGLSSGLTPETGAVRPAPEVVQGMEGLVSYRASVSLRREHRPVARCDIPVLAAVGDGSYTLANGPGTPDAAIYYIAGAEGFPGQADPAAVLYAGPIELEAGETISFAAWRADRLPSHVVVKTIS